VKYFNKIRKTTKGTQLRWKSILKAINQGQFRSKMKEWQHSIIEKMNKANLHDQLVQAQGDELV
jgi:hypothetical protein